MRVAHHCGKNVKRSNNSFVDKILLIDLGRWEVETIVVRVKISADIQQWNPRAEQARSSLEKKIENELVDSSPVVVLAHLQRM